MISEKIYNEVDRLLEEFYAKVTGSPEKAFVLKLHGCKGTITGYKIEEDGQIQ